GSSGRTHALAQLTIREVPAHRVAEGVGIARGNEQAVDAVAHDLADAACLHREHGRADREGLGDGVREVLPARGEDRRVRSAEELDDTLARQGAEEANAAVDAQLVRARLERPAIGALTGDHELHAVRASDRFERAAERFLRRQPARERDRRAVEAEAPLQLAASRNVVERGHRVRENAHERGGDAPTDRELAQVRARTEHVRSAPKLDVTRETKRGGRDAAAAALELVDVPAHEPAAPP